MKDKIGQIIKNVATAQGLTQQQFGEKINRTKQGAANIYRRSTIDTELLKSISRELNHDFFSYYYEDEPLKSFRDNESKGWLKQIENLQEELAAKDTLLEKNEEILSLQRKYITELEEKIARAKESN
ncbi:hypothetical protein [Sphingobacterium sp. 1.A.4]|uniref:hypothetical protein n=1 Tax=Sphingobacterium TaxID=28453 RepID=UPI000C0BCC6D|nr:hypothetical protein [Sphingobacterium sp. 1.A.4]